MTIQVALYAGLTRYLPRGAQDRKATLEVPDGATVLEVMQKLGVPDDVPCILVVDGKRATAETVLRDGETFSLFPPLTGGAAAPDRAV
jgi:molybdopterin synthase sulfur carrier subunit